MRRPLLLALSLLTATAACTSLLGDFTLKETAGDGGTSDGGPDVGDDGSGEAAAGTCTAVASDVSVYLGQRATLDATASSDSSGAKVNYTWSVGSVPTGSTIPLGTLANGSAAQPTFLPDVAGDYKLILAIDAVDCHTASTAVVVHADLPQVLFARGTVVGTTAQASYVVADLDGGPPRPVMCADTIVTSVQNEIATFAAYAGRAYDFWEAPAGQPSNYAAFTVDFQGGNYYTHLYAGTTASGCDASPPADLGFSAFGPGAPFGTQPSFNPKGTRFAVYDAQWNIATYGSDGNSQHSVSKYSAGQNGAPIFDTLGRGSGNNEPPRVVWKSSGTEVAWARSNASTGGWEVVTAQDGASSTPTLFMSCAGVTPREIALLSDGSVIAGYRDTPTSGENIFQFTVDAQQKCVSQHQYTKVADASGAIAADFAVSPDEKTIAFLQLDPTVQDASLWSLTPSGQYPGGYVYTVPVDNSTTPQQVSSQPALFGPRWIGGGTMLVFTGLDATFDGGPPKTSVVVIAPNGSGRQVIAQGDGQKTFVSTSGSAGCDVVSGRAAPVGGALLSLAAFAELVRRRRRRR